eukprot:2306824-Pleurochrysis_carterae.AAC.9
MKRDQAELPAQEADHSACKVCTYACTTSGRAILNSACDVAREHKSPSRRLRFASQDYCFSLRLKQFLSHLDMEMVRASDLSLLPFAPTAPSFSSAPSPSFLVRFS